MNPTELDQKTYKCFLSLILIKVVFKQGRKRLSALGICRMAAVMMNRKNANFSNLSRNILEYFPYFNINLQLSHLQKPKFSSLISFLSLLSPISRFLSSSVPCLKSLVTATSFPGLFSSAEKSARNEVVVRPATSFPVFFCLHENEVEWHAVFLVSYSASPNHTLLKFQS